MRPIKKLYERYFRRDGGINGDDDFSIHDYDFMLPLKSDR